MIASVPSLAMNRAFSEERHPSSVKKELAESTKEFCLLFYARVRHRRSDWEHTLCCAIWSPRHRAMELRSSTGSPPSASERHRAWWPYMEQCLLMYSRPACKPSTLLATVLPGIVSHRPYALKASRRCGVALSLAACASSSVEASSSPSTSRSSGSSLALSSDYLSLSKVYSAQRPTFPNGLSSSSVFRLLCFAHVTGMYLFVSSIQVRNVNG